MSVVKPYPKTLFQPISYLYGPPVFIMSRFPIHFCCIFAIAVLMLSIWAFTLHFFSCFRCNGGVLTYNPLNISWSGDKIDEKRMEDGKVWILCNDFVQICLRDLSDWSMERQVFTDTIHRSLLSLSLQWLWLTPCKWGPISTGVLLSAIEISLRLE